MLNSHTSVGGVGEGRSVGEGDGRSVGEARSVGEGRREVWVRNR